MIHVCTCKHEWQDKTYGKWKRVHNPGPPGPQFNIKCTVCENKKIINTKS